MQTNYKYYNLTGYRGVIYDYVTTRDICYDYINGKITKKEFKDLKKAIKKEYGWRMERFGVETLFRKILKEMKSC